MAFSATCWRSEVSDTVVEEKLDKVDEDVEEVVDEEDDEEEDE